MEESSRFGSLSERIETFTGASSQTTNTAYRGLRNLFRLLQPWHGSPSLAIDQIFLNTVSTTQKNSVALLGEWWERKQDAELASAVKPHIFALALFPPKASGDISAVEGKPDELQQLAPEGDRKLLRAVYEQLQDGQGELYLKTQERMRMTYPNLGGTFGTETAFYGSLYHNKMLQLFDSEFISLETSPESEFAAQQAATTAAATRLGYSCLGHLRMNSQSEAIYPLEPRGSHGFQGHRQGISAISNPCSWLQSDKASGMQLPRYLWDIDGERTIDTLDLESHAVPYSIISHTWGRWRKDGDGANVPGISLWRVPENTLFDVRELPKTLKQAGFAERYVWLDLFCIPQERENAALAPIAQVELARQADIFRNASTAVVWFTDIDSWTNAEANVAWLALTYLQDGARDYHAGVRDKIVHATSALWDHASISSGFHPGVGESRRQVPGWMSSLWTLQEVCIRSDMALMNRNLELFLVGRDTVLTFDLLVALFSCAYFDRDWREDLTSRNHSGQSEEDYGVFDEMFMDGFDGNLDELDAPRGVVDLADVLLDTGSMDLLGADRLTPVVLGTKRTATASRGEAVMAVAGAVAWHMGRSVEQFQNATDASDDLLFGLYPFAFVQELRWACGATFFTYQQDVATLISQLKGTKTRLIDPGYRGTMLPFMKGSPGAYNILAGTNIADRHVTDHPSVQNWTLERDGSVRLTQAAIVVSGIRNATLETRDLASEIIAEITYNDPFTSMQQVTNLKGDLVDVVRSLKKEAVAICTMSSGSQLLGIILQRSTRGTGSFVKAGTFYSLLSQSAWKVFSVPETVPVDWHVL